MRGAGALACWLGAGCCHSATGRGGPTCCWERLHRGCTYTQLQPPAPPHRRTRTRPAARSAPWGHCTPTSPHPPAARSLRLAPSTAGYAGCSCGGASASGHQQHAAPPPADVHLVKPAESLVPTATQQLWLCRTATARWPRRGLKKQRTCAIHCPRQAVGQPGAGPANTGRGTRPREGLTETGLQVRPSRDDNDALCTSPPTAYASLAGAQRTHRAYLQQAGRLCASFGARCARSSGAHSATSAVSIPARAGAPTHRSQAWRCACV